MSNPFEKPEEKDKEEENIWGIESFKRLVGEAEENGFEELIGEMKDYEGDREEIFKVAISRAMELANGNPDKAVKFASKFDSLRCAHLFIKNYAENNEIKITNLHSFFSEIDPRAEDEKGGPAFDAMVILIEKALKDYAESETELSLEQIIDICSCCTYQVRKYPRVELETKMLEALSPHLKGKSIDEYKKIQNNLPTNLMKYESLVSFVEENEGKFNLKEMITLMETVALEDFFKELRDGTLLSLIVECEKLVEMSDEEDIQELKQQIGRLTPKAQKSPFITKLLEKIDAKLEGASNELAEAA